MSKYTKLTRKAYIHSNSHAELTCKSCGAAATKELQSANMVYWSILCDNCIENAMKEDHMKTENKSVNVQVLEALNNYYLEINYSPNPVACQLKAADTLLKVLDPSSWSCAICSNDMTTEITEDQLKLCHACFCDIFEAGK